MIKTISDTIIWLAEQRHAAGEHPSVNSIIHAIKLEVTQLLMDYMKEHISVLEKYYKILLMLL